MDQEFQNQTQLQETNITNISDDHVSAPQLQPIFSSSQNLFENPNSLIYNSSSQNTPCFDPFDYNFTFPKPTSDFDFYECKPLIDHNNNNGVHAQVMDNFHGGELSTFSNSFSNFHKMASLPLDVMMMSGGDHQSHVMMSSSSLGLHQEAKPVSFMAPDEVSSVTGYYSKKPNIQYHHNINIHHQHHDMDRAATRKACTTKAGKKSNLVKGQWTIDEDRVLSRLVEQYGIRKWSTIAQMLPGRIGKQCRERWHNHLRPDIKKDTWSEEEDKVLIEAHAEIGNKWAEIAKRLPGRTENSIKNHWNATKRRQYSKRKCRSKYPRPSLLQDYIKSLNLDPGKSDRHKKISRQDHKSSHSTSQSLEFCQTTNDRLVPNYEFSYEVPDFVFDDRMFEESCSIDSLLDDMAPNSGHDLGVLDEFQVKKELDLVEMMSQVNNN